MKICELIRYIEQQVPLMQQEEYDNSGVQCGDVHQDISGVLIAIDITEAVVEEAIQKQCNLIITHHPPLFRGTKSITPDYYINRSIIKAIQHNITIYSAHTSLDNDDNGVNVYWAKKMGLTNIKVLQPLTNYYHKVVTYVPASHSEKIRVALKEIGVGRQGEYEGTSFTSEGIGRFIPLEGAQPYCGTTGEWHKEPEERIEVLVEKPLVSSAVKTIRLVHPYEEPAIDVLPTQYTNPLLGAGIIGDLPTAITLSELLDRMRTFQPITHVAHSKILEEKIKRVAYGGGSCNFLLKTAAKEGADIFITGEAKYNDYYDAEELVTLLTIGHYESELLTKEILYEIISEKRGNFATYRALSCANPVHYI